MNGGSANVSFRTDNAVLNAQHRKLLALCQRASRLHEDSSSGYAEKFHIILNDLATYAREAFEAEENLLRQKRPALLDQHLAEHISYESQLTDLLISASNGEFDHDKLLRFLTAWWSSHVLQSDRHVMDSLE